MATIAQGGDKQAAMNMLYRKYAGSVVFLSSFANLPDLVIATVRKRTPKGITALVDELKAKGLFASMGPRSIWRYASSTCGRRGCLTIYLSAVRTPDDQTSFLATLR